MYAPWHTMKTTASEKSEAWRGVSIAFSREGSISVEGDRGSALVVEEVEVVQHSI